MAKNIFETVQVTAPNYSQFDLSHDHKTSMKMGFLIPVWCQETLPGDNYHMASEAMFRLMPMVAPIMHKVDVTFHHFFVPNRLIWPNWEKFITGGETTAGSGLVPAAPFLNFPSGELTASSLANYLGAPVMSDKPASNVQLSALPFAAYHRIFNDWYRDQNLQPIDEEDFILKDGAQPVNIENAISNLRRRAWEHDYFTSALPFAQKGDAVELPIDMADTPVKWRITQDPNVAIMRDHQGAPQPNDTLGTDSDGYLVTSGGAPVGFDPNGSLYVGGDDISFNTTINDLRTAWALQQFLEKNMRAGSRYKESLLAHFGVRSSDGRLDRAEYIGGAKGTIAVSEVLQTSSSDQTTPQGNMAGHGISVMGTGGAHYRCEEHGFIISLVSVRPTTAYFQGIPRFFQKFDRMQYAFPDFATLGEQEILNKEVYADGSPEDNNVFGYIPRFAEYRFQNARVSGEMATSLKHWHMARDFASRPHLNSQFIEANPTKRIFAVEDEETDCIVAQIFNSITATRPLPVYGIPAPLV